MVLFALKPAEPVTLVTDLLLASQGLVYGFLLILLWIRNKKRQPLLPAFIATYFAIMLFALCGAISHGTTNTIIADLFWPPTVIFGGFAFFFFNIGVLLIDPPVNAMHSKNAKKTLWLPVGLLIVYLIGLVVAQWAFILFVAYQLICSLMIFGICRKIHDPNLQTLTKAIVSGLTILLIAGVIQAIGSAFYWQIAIGAQHEYLFKPHNDIFHVIAMIGLYVIYYGIATHYRIPEVKKAD